MNRLYSNKKRKFTNYAQTWYVWSPGKLNCVNCRASSTKGSDNYIIYETILSIVTSKAHFQVYLILFHVPQTQNLHQNAYTCIRPVWTKVHLLAHYDITWLSYSLAPHPRVLSPFGEGGGGLRASLTQITMLAGVFILLVEPPKPDRLKDRGQTK